MATLTRHPNEVLTDRGDNPRPEKRAENADVKLIRGRSSATTTQDRTQARFTPFALMGKILKMRLIHRACERGEMICPLIHYKYRGFPIKFGVGGFLKDVGGYVVESEPGGGGGDPWASLCEDSPSEMAFI
jgi:hypothetical protein